MDKIDRVFAENRMKRPEGLFYYLVKDVIIVSLDCKEWYSLVFDNGLKDLTPFHHTNRVPNELGIALGFYDTPI